MPESKSRKKPEKAAAKPAAVKIPKPTTGNPVWLVPTMLTLFIVGILWVVVFYLTSGGLRLPIPAIGQWNIAAGFALILAGFILATRWK